MNNWSITGNVGKDAVVRQVNSTSATSWSLAVKSGYGDREQTLWVDCTMWGDRGERIADYIRKGDPLGVTGELGIREHDGKTYLTLKVTELTLLGGKRDREGGDRPQRNTGSTAKQYRDAKDGGKAPPADDFDDSSIPF
ncbi:single-stranded DNA-binding protein [Tabrizicola sp.]|uniref:single-stranded DNA-binding protein n=1 Tax=Tabrizicola sp. TaxID=2005166 RepID=UPI003F2E03D2